MNFLILPHLTGACSWLNYLMGKSSEEILEFDRVLEYLSAYALSGAGRQRCLSAQIYNEAAKIKYELDLTSEARKIINDALNVPIDNIYDIEKSLNDAAKHIVLSAEEIINTARTLRTSRLMLNFTASISREFPMLAAQNEALYTDKELESMIFAAFTPSYTVKEDASPELKSLHQILRDTRANVKSCISSLMQDADFSSNLQETLYTERAGRTVFQVKAECRNKVSGIIHDVSSTGRTLFIEPEILVSLNNKIRETEVRIEIEIQKILKKFSDLIGSAAQKIQNSNQQLIEYDFIFAKAKYSASFDGAAAKISDKKIINLKMMKNPVLIKSKKDIVENDFYMDENKNCVIITGSNTGGKTVILKTAGLLTLMTKAGLHIPCYEAEIYPFKKVFADIGDEQSILSNLSTFSAQMTNIKSIVNNADDESLIVLDEPASGTDPDEGAAIAQAVLEYLQKKGAFIITAAHFGALKSLAYLKAGFVNASVEFNLKTLQPSYRLLTGVPGSSNAIAVCTNLGLSEEIIKNARENYFNKKDDTRKVFEELQKIQQELSEKLKDAAEREENAKRLEQSLNDQLNEIKKDKKKNIHIYKKKYETSIEEAREEIKAIVKEMREEKSEKIARRSFNRLAGIETAMRKGFMQEEDEIAEKYTPIDWNNVKTGSKAMVKDLNQEVEILELPDRNKNVLVQMGLLKTKIKMDKLAVLNKNLIKREYNAKDAFKKGFKRGLEKGFEIERRTLSQTLDLRGFRAEEALDAAEAYLDKASLAGLSPVYIIHGHGTGALKQVIRDYLQHSPYVSKYRAGEAAEGGDGVSIVDIA